jgi:hypothetical protein
MSKLTSSLRNYAGHTGKYYSRLLEPASVKLLILFIAILAVIASATMAHALSFTPFKWVVEDVLNDAILTGNYDYILNADAPAPSDNAHHLQMPMMFEGYLPGNIFVSGGSGGPDNQRIDDMLSMTMKPSFVGDDLEIADAGEFDDAIEDNIKLIADRPVLSGLD